MGFPWPVAAQGSGSSECSKSQAPNAAGPRVAQQWAVKKRVVVISSWPLFVLGRSFSALGSHFSRRRPVLSRSHALLAGLGGRKAFQRFDGEVGSLFNIRRGAEAAIYSAASRDAASRRVRQGDVAADVH